MTKAKELSELASAATVTSGNVALSGGLDVDGTTDLDVVDIDGAANFAADVTFASGADIITASEQASTQVTALRLAVTTTPQWAMRLALQLQLVITI